MEVQGEEKINNVDNTYFYKPDETIHTYEGYFYLHSYTDLWQDVDLYITKLEDFSDGTLYALELEQPESSDPFDELYGHKYIGYFYVMDEIIYRYNDYPTGEDGYTDENGYHSYVEVKADRRIHRFYNDYFYGSKDYMLMVWEKGKGLRWTKSTQ